VTEHRSQFRGKDRNSIIVALANAGLSMTQIGNLLGISRNASSGILHRVRFKNLKVYEVNLSEVFTPEELAPRDERSYRQKSPGFRSPRPLKVHGKPQLAKFDDLFAILDAAAEPEERSVPAVVEPQRTVHPTASPSGRQVYPFGREGRGGAFCYEEAVPHALLPDHNPPQPIKLLLELESFECSVVVGHNGDENGRQTLHCGLPISQTDQKICDAHLRAFAREYVPVNERKRVKQSVHLLRG